MWEPRHRSAVAAPPPRLPIRWQPEACTLLTTALALLADDVHRPRVRLRAAGAPPHLPLQRQPEVWHLQVGINPIVTLGKQLLNMIGNLVRSG
jgi:hypothetical protein